MWRTRRQRLIPPPRRTEAFPGEAWTGLHRTKQPFTTELADIVTSRSLDDLFFDADDARRRSQYRAPLPFEHPQAGLVDRERRCATDGDSRAGLVLGRAGDDAKEAERVLRVKAECLRRMRRYSEVGRREPAWEG